MPPPTCHPRATHLIDARRARQARPAGEFDAGPGERQGILVDVAEGLLGTALLDREPSAESSEADCAPEVESILKRLGIDGSMWLDLVWSFKKYYQGSAAGMPDTLARDASAHQRISIAGVAASGRCVGSDRCFGWVMVRD